MRNPRGLYKTSLNYWRMAENRKAEDIMQEISKKLEDSPHLLIIISLTIFLLVSLLIRHDVTKLLFNLIVIGSTGFLAYLSISSFSGFKKDKWNVLPALMGVALIAVIFKIPGDTLLILLLTAYMALSALVAGRIIKPQTAVVMVLAVTAILFRVYPALPGSGPMPGHLISMDDPYYHYKQTEKLYEMGTIPRIDFTIYPPHGRAAPHKFPYYYNTYLALMTGNPIRDITILYPLLISAFGAVMMFFFIKELTGDWKSGMFGGLFFATMPALLTKSVAGAIEEDLMGMVLGIFSLYLLAKAMKSDGRENTKYAVLSGVAFFITIVSWKGVVFLFAIPFTALGIYSIFSILLKYDIWRTIRAAIIAGAIPIAGNLVFLTNFHIDVTQIGPYGFMLFMGVLAELIRIRIWKKEDTKHGLEKRYFTQFAAIVIIATLIALFAIGIDRILSVPQKAFEEFAGTSAHNFLVDKTISEQAALARGDLIKKLTTGYTKYHIAEPLTVIMAVLVPVFLLYYFFKDRDRMFELLRAYLICLIFFLVAMQFVWVEARLTFSQSLGFLLLGSMIGLMLPNNWKEMGSWKVITLLVVMVVIPFTIFYPYNNSDAWKRTKIPAPVDPAWFLGVKWLDEHIRPGAYIGDKYINGDYVLTWWDYGHFITALSRATVIADPLQAGEEYIMRIARFFYNTTSEDEAMQWLMEQPWNPKDPDGGHKVKYVILDYSLIGKSGALSFLGTNYYQYPNGYTAVNGTCEVGEICQNVENGLVAEKKKGKYVCSQGVVCTRDLLTQVEKKMCCEENPTKCCNSSLDWHVIVNKGGSAKILRRPGQAVYGQYQLNTKGYACKPAYSTSLKPVIFPENGQRKTAIRTYLYTGFSGLRYADGGDYPAFIVRMYSDGSQDLKFISSNCELKDYNEVMASGKDALINMRYGQRLSEDVIAPQIFIHVPERWMNAMFTQLYLFDAKNLKYFTLVTDDKTKLFYPSVKIYKVTYPDEIPKTEEETESQEQEMGQGETETEPVAKMGDIVEVEYVGKFENGTVFDSSLGREPLQFTIGAGQVIPGFEDAVVGMKLGESKLVTIPPEQAYGTGTDNPLAGKTLIFEITLVSLNGEKMPVPEEDEKTINITFDYYDPSLPETYNLNNFPSIVWNCQYKKIAKMSDPELEMDVLRKITCILNKAEPKEICEPLGITYSDGSITADLNITGVLRTIKKLDNTTPCAPGENRSLLQVFYTKVCPVCEEQKPLLDQLAEEFGDYVNISYYCVGDESYCSANSLVSI